MHRQLLIKKILRYTRNLLILFFTSTLLTVIIYRFMPVYITPLMVIRSVQQIISGDISEPWLLLIVSFGDAFVLSFVSLGVMRCGGSAGWLVRWLLVFSASLASPLMYLYWLRHLTGRRRFDGLEAACVLCLCALIGSVDFRLVSPLLARLIHG